MTAARISRETQLRPEQVSDVLSLIHACGDADGAFPLSEHVVLHIRHGGEAQAVHLLARQDDRLVGYAHVDATDPVEGASAELCVHPLYRRQGLGRTLVEAAILVADERSGGRLRLWAHGDHPSASALAIGLNFRRTRVLWQMRRSLFAPVPEPALPPDVTLRPFRVGQDEQRWLEVNAAAFADHPDQGKWTIDDLRARLREPWFDPDGFLLAESGNHAGTDAQLLGFHWTKVHGEVRGHHHEHTDTAPHAHDPIGEVYVLGVAPSANGTGLGSALTLAGLRYLRGRGLDQAMLYVDESNSKAVALYQRLGFVRWSTDVSFYRAGNGAPGDGL